MLNASNTQPNSSDGSENGLLLGSIRTMPGFGWFRFVPELPANPRRVGDACGVGTAIDRSDWWTPYRNLSLWQYRRRIVPLKRSPIQT